MSKHLGGPPLVALNGLRGWSVWSARADSWFTGDPTSLARDSIWSWPPFFAILKLSQCNLVVGSDCLYKQTHGMFVWDQSLPTSPDTCNCASKWQRKCCWDNTHIIGHIILISLLWNEKYTIQNSRILHLIDQTFYVWCYVSQAIDRELTLQSSCIIKDTSFVE